jgi:murein DD-endopeptidase MepM/ murein hydrolase activator NlpD
LPLPPYSALRLGLLTGIRPPSLLDLATDPRVPRTTVPAQQAPQVYIRPGLRAPARDPRVVSGPPDEATAMNIPIDNSFGGIMRRLFAGPDNPQLSREQNVAAGQQAMVQAGLYTLAQGGDAPGLSGIAQGILHGQQVGQAVQSQYVQQARTRALGVMMSGAGGANHVDRLRGSFNTLLALGDTEGARAVGMVLQSELAAQPNRDPVALSPGGRLVDPQTGQVVATAPERTPEYANRVVAGVRQYFDPRDPSRVVYEAPAGEDPAIAQERLFRRENTLADDYTRATEKSRQTYDSIANALSGVAEARAGNGAAQTGLLYSFVTSLDPTSVVRDSEVSLVRSASPLRARVEGILRQVQEGGDVSALVNQRMVDEIADFMQRRQAAAAEVLSDTHSQFQERANRWGVDPGVFRAPPPRAQPSGGGGTGGQASTARPPLRFPVGAVVQGGEVISRFGEPRDGGRRSHEGWDIGAPAGTPVTAPFGGRITRMSTNDPKGGVSVIVQGPGMRGYFAHFDRHAEGLRNGMTIEPGAVLGYVGNSGNARDTTAHLHVQFTNNRGQRIDPAQVFGAPSGADLARVAPLLTSVGGLGQGRRR